MLEENTWTDSGNKEFKLVIKVLLITSFASLSALASSDADNRFYRDLDMGTTCWPI